MAETDTKVDTKVEAKEEEPKDTNPITEEQKAALKKQIDFYFSDSNYTKDTFLRKAAHDNGGWIPVSLLTTFNRIKKVTVDVEQIASIMVDSEVVEVSEDKTKMKRRHPLPQDDVVTPRSIYVKGLPKNAEETNLEALQKYFSQFGTVLSVRIRRVFRKKDLLKGSAYIEYESKEAAEKVVALGAFNYLDKHPLLVRMKKEYLEWKKEETRIKKRKRQEALTEYPPGTILKFPKLPAEVTRDMIKAFFVDHGQVAFVDTNKSEEFTFVRFKKDLRAAICISALEGQTPQIEGHDITLELVKDEEEAAYWKDNVKGQKKKKRRTK